MIAPTEYEAVTALHTLPRVTDLAIARQDSIQVFAEAHETLLPSEIFADEIEPLGPSARDGLARRSVVTDPVSLIKLNDVLVTGHRDLFTQDGRYLTDLWNQNGLHARPPALQPGEVSADLVDDTAGFLFFHSDSGDSHASWLLQTLPQLRLFDMAGLRPDKLIVQPNIRAYQRETLRALGWEDRDILVRPPERPVVFRELYAGYVDGGVGLAPDLKVYDRLRDALPRPKRRRRKADRKIYVSHQDTGSTLLNENRLIERVRELGFTIVIPGTRSLAEDIAIFRDARLICGPVGAGLCNTLFTDRGATIVALSNPHHDTTRLRQIAALRGHSLGWMFGLTFGGSDDATHTSWLVDLDRVTDMLAKLGR